MSDTLVRDFVRYFPEGARKSLLQRHFGAWFTAAQIFLVIEKVRRFRKRALRGSAKNRP